MFLSLQLGGKNLAGYKTNLVDINNIFMNSAKSTHRDKTRARVYISFDFIFFPHLNM